MNMKVEELELANREYKYGFGTEIEADTVPRGLNEEIIRLIGFPKLIENWPRWRGRLARSIVGSARPKRRLAAYLPSVRHQPRMASVPTAGLQAVRVWAPRCGG